MTRDDPELTAVKLLEAMAQHRAVDLVEDVTSDLDNQIRADADDIPVERGVVELAQ